MIELKHHLVHLKTRNSFLKYIKEQRLSSHLRLNKNEWHKKYYEMFYRKRPGKRAMIPFAPSSDFETAGIEIINGSPLMDPPMKDGCWNRAIYFYTVTLRKSMFGLITLDDFQLGFASFFIFFWRTIKFLLMDGQKWRGVCVGS